MQQSAAPENKLRQLFEPHLRSPMHSSSLSQSPSIIPQGFEVEQHDQVLPVQSHPENESIKKRVQLDIINFNII